MQRSWEWEGGGGGGAGGPGGGPGGGEIPVIKLCWSVRRCQARWGEGGGKRTDGGSGEEGGRVWAKLQALVYHILP